MFIFLVSVNSDKCFNRATQIYAQRVKLCLGILRTKADTQGAIRFFRRQAKRRKRTRGGFAVRGASRAAGNADLLCRKMIVKIYYRKLFYVIKIKPLRIFRFQQTTLGTQGNHSQRNTEFFQQLVGALSFYFAFIPFSSKYFLLSSVESS